MRGREDREDKDQEILSGPRSDWDDGPSLCLCETKKYM